jgi:malate dehydrogenase
MSKVTVIGAGNVGATVADVLAHKDFIKEIVLVDIRGEFAQGKALDIWQSAPIGNYSTRLTGTSDYAYTKDSDIVVITAGLPRKPGMSRDDLISTNAKIVVECVNNVLQHSKDPIIIIVSNPLDVMTHAAFKASKLKSSRVFGMAGILDTARYTAFLAEAIDTSPKDIKAILMGGHGDTMVPLPRYTTVSGIPVTELLDEATLDTIVQRTKVGGGELVQLMGTSAWYAPGAAAAQMVESILKDENRILPVCAYLDGVYGMKGLYLGAPAKLGKGGITEIVELKLNEAETDLLNKSAVAVQEVIDVFEAMNLV